MFNWFDVVGVAWEDVDRGIVEEGNDVGDIVVEDVEVMIVDNVETSSFVDTTPL